MGHLIYELYPDILQAKPVREQILVDLISPDDRVKVQLLDGSGSLVYTLAPVSHKFHGNPCGRVQRKGSRIVIERGDLPKGIYCLQIRGRQNYSRIIILPN